MNNAPVTYWDYIRVEELLALQGGVERDESLLSNDEVMFITVHQIYELWFKLMRRELRKARDLFRAGEVAEQELSGVVQSLARVTTILRRCIDHFEVMETLTTREYLTFRDKLMPASGFQSAQLRQIEILLGLAEAERIPLEVEGDYRRALAYADGSTSPALARVEQELKDGPPLKQVIEDWLWRTPIDGVTPSDPGAAEELERFVEKYLAAHERQLQRACERALLLATNEPAREHLRARYAGEAQAVRAFLNPADVPDAERTKRIRVAMIFIVTYRELPLLAWPRELLDGLLELEQVFVIFRQRHARMVERVIGRRTGTGGSSGVEYLDRTAATYRIYRDLWAVRTLMIAQSDAPALANPDFYEFRSSPRAAR